MELECIQVAKERAERDSGLKEKELHGLNDMYKFKYNFLLEKN